MYPATLYPKTVQVLEKICNQSFLAGFYLAGGTALALQLGHRKSIDLDFFTQDSFNPKTLLRELAVFNPTVLQETTGTLDVMIDDVKVSFFEYKYPLLEQFTEFSGILLASVLDIACMKFTAISSRGSRKDFIDLYFVLNTLSLNHIFEQFEIKFQNIKYSRTHILKSLTYFVDAETDPDVDYLIPISWEEIKQSLTKDVVEYMNKIKT